MRKLRFILVQLAVLFAGVACNKELQPAGTASGECSAVFRLTSKDQVTLRTKSPADDLLDGLRFTNVLVILVDRSDNVVGNVYKEYPYDPSASGNDPHQGEVTGSSLTEDVIHFDHLNPGNYTAYAYANIDAEAWQKSGEEISASGQEKYKVSGSFSAFLERELKAVNPVTPSIAGESSMLLTGQAEVPVGLSVETHDIYLKRPVVRFRVYINNTTPYPVRMDELRFSDFNADKAYIIGQSDENGVPSVPAGVTYGPLPSYPILSTSPETAPQSGAPGYQEEYLVYETLLYENACTDPYEIYALFTLDPNGLNLQMPLGEKIIEPVSANTLSAMANGDHMDVIITYPRKQTRSARLYYGVSADNYYAWESCGYEDYSDLLDRVQAIFTESPSHYYVGYSFTGYAGAQSGIAGWTGLLADAPVGTETNGPTVTFDYTGANSGTSKKYVRTLTRGADGKFSFDGLSTTTTSLTNMRIQQGSKIDGEKRFAKDLPASCMINFIKDDTGLYLRSDCLYNNSLITNSKQSQLIWQSYTSDKQDFQFTLFRENIVRAPLRRILKESHKEVPLTYMSRNEDIKLVINVFYADQEATVNFEVDNSTWRAPAQSSHTFN
jgi:hypothetical protein